MAALQAARVKGVSWVDPVAVLIYGAKCTLQSNPRRKLLACHRSRTFGIMETPHLVPKTRRGEQGMGRSRADEEVSFIQSWSLQRVQALPPCWVWALGGGAGAGAEAGKPRVEKRDEESE